MLDILETVIWWAVPAVADCARDTEPCPVPELTSSCVGSPQNFAASVRHSLTRGASPCIDTDGVGDPGGCKSNVKEARFEDYPTDWAYQALTHARNGTFAEARRWLERLRTLRPVPLITFSDLQELGLLRSEVEGLLFDAEFPGRPGEPSFRRSGVRTVSRSAACTRSIS